MRHDTNQHDQSVATQFKQMTNPAGEHPGKRRLAVPDGATCPSCRYDLVGHNAAEPCPACGARGFVPIIMARVLPDWARCTHCGHGLAGLDPTGRCPECAAPASFSLEPQAYRFAHPKLVKAHAKGAASVFRATIVSIIAPIVGLGVIIPLAFTGSATPTIIAGGLLLLSMAWIAAMFVGGWLGLTRRDPILPDPKSRKLTRIGLFTMLATIVGLPIAAVLFGAQVTFGPLQTLGAVTLMFAGSALFFFAGLTYIRWVAWRLGEPGLRRFAGTCLWLLPLLQTVGSLIYVGPLAASIIYIVLLGKTAGRLRRERRAADIARCVAESSHAPGPGAGRAAA